MDENNTEELIFRSASKEEIIEVKNLLRDNAITNIKIKLYTHVIMPQYRENGSYNELMESNNELMFPIEDFNEKLLDGECFEIYVEKSLLDKAIAVLKENINNFNQDFLKHCVYMAQDYELAEFIKAVLETKEIQCAEIKEQLTEDNKKGFLVYVKEELYEKACDLLEMHEDEINNKTALVVSRKMKKNFFMFFIRMIVVISGFAAIGYFVVANFK